MIFSSILQIAAYFFFAYFNLVDITVKIDLVIVLSGKHELWTQPGLVENFVKVVNLPHKLQKIVSGIIIDIP